MFRVGLEKHLKVISMETNGKAQQISDLIRRADNTDTELKELHGRVTDLRRDFERLIGQLIALKWVIGGGVAWMIVERVLAQ